MKQSTHKKFHAYYRAIRYLESLGNITGGYQKTNLKSHPRPEMFLERMQSFLDRLGNPEKGFKYIHITGTAGKGSVATLVHMELVRAGKRAGIFTSPFAVSTIEKIQVGTKYIDPYIFAKLTETLKPHIDAEILCGRYGTPSYFEMIFAISLLYFKLKKCEYVVLEVGLGGRFDATNIIMYPMVTAITNIGLDHTNILGKTVSDIAKDKSGIIKKGSIFFSSEENKRILQIFRHQCSTVGAEFRPLIVKGLSPDQRNHLLAGSICTYLGVIKDVKELKGNTELPARFEMVEKHPMIIIDGAHNPSKIESVVGKLNQLKYRNISLIFAVSADKDWKSMMKILVPHVHHIYVTRFNIPGRQAVDPKLLYQEARKYLDMDSICLFSDPIEAYRSAKKIIHTSDVLLITGSFYLAGEIRSLFCSEEQILKNRNSHIN
jgi:dihydrofolate synthase/folylpolyglutamate synthase